MDFAGDATGYVEAAVLTALYVIGLVFFARRSRQGKANRWLLVVFTAIMLAFGVIVGQGVSFRREQSELESRARNLSRAVENAALTAARLPEFRREVVRRDALLEVLRTMVPAKLDPERFLAELERLAAVRGVELVHLSTATERFDFYEQATLHFELRGDDEGIDALHSDFLGLSRFAHWTDGGDGTAFVVIYAAQAPSDTVVLDFCDGHSSSAVWLPPYRDELATRRADLEELCRRYDTLEPVALQVHAYQNVLREVETLEDVIERLK